MEVRSFLETWERRITSSEICKEFSQDCLVLSHRQQAVMVTSAHHPMPSPAFDQEVQGLKLVESLEELDQLAAILSSAMAAYASWRDVFERYMTADGRVSRTLPITPPTDDYTNSTCTAFCLYIASRSRALLVEESLHSKQILEDTKITKAAAVLEKLDHTLKRPSSSSHQSEPNGYNTTIKTAGLLAALNTQERAPSVPCVTNVKKVSDFLLNTLIIDKEFVGRLENTDIPSAYMTFWTITALEELCELVQKNPACGTTAEMDQARKAIRSLRQWAKQRASVLIARHHAKAPTHIDTSELLLSIACMATSDPDPEGKNLCGHGLSIAFESYFQGGIFTQNDPIFSNKDHVAIYASTAETLTLIALKDRSLLLPYVEHLRIASEWIAGHAREDGWAGERDGTHTAPNAFSTVTAVAFQQLYVHILDDALALSAAKLLKVPPFTSLVGIKDYKYPSKVGEAIEQHIKMPRDPATRNPKVAACSMVLYGPPGTSKTTIAKQVALDLKWPLLIIDQSDFLRSGFDNIEAEASRVFRLAGFLRETVILFDEIEELVKERGEAGEASGSSKSSAGQSSGSDKMSRMLTTAMLPKVHDLRDKARTVFIFATNYPASIDVAMRRLGRFDIIMNVPPPDATEAQAILNALLKSYDFTPGNAKVIKDQGEERVQDKEKHFTVVDIKEILRQLKVWEMRNPGKDFTSKTIDTHFREFPTLTTDELKKFTELAESDRPKPISDTP